MASKVEELRKQAALIAEQLAAAEAEALESGFSKIEKICADYEITVEQLASHFGFGGSKAKKVFTGAKAVRASPKVTHIDPANSLNTWSSRGRAPRWLQAYIDSGKSKDDFKVK